MASASASMTARSTPAVISRALHHLQLQPNSPKALGRPSTAIPSVLQPRWGARTSQQWNNTRSAPSQRQCALCVAAGDGVGNGSAASSGAGASTAPPPPPGNGPTYREGNGSSSKSSSSSSSSRNSGGASAGRRRQVPEVREVMKLMQELGELAVSTAPRAPERLLIGARAVANVSTLALTEFLERGRQLSPQRLLRLLFEGLGPTYVKLGQFIASSPTLFPAEFVEEFQSCLDRTPPVPYDIIKRTIEAELGQPIDRVFEYIEQEPLASASIAQVHAGVLRGSGAEVAIKVLKPGVEDVLQTDLNVLYGLGRVLEVLSPDLSRSSLVPIIGDIRASMIEEVDFTKEAKNIAQFRAFLNRESIRSVTAPLVYETLSTKSILVMERFHGVPLTDLESIRRYAPNGDAEGLLINALNTWFASVLVCESFHADVHSGNLMVLPDGRLAFIDFGIVGRISSKTWAAVQSFLAGFAVQDYTTMARGLVEIGATGPEVDVDSFAADLKRVLERVNDSAVANVVVSSTGPGIGGTVASASLVVDEDQINNLLLDIVAVSETYGLRFPREFGLLLKQLLYFDRYTRLLAPELSVLSDARIRYAKA